MLPEVHLVATTAAEAVRLAPVATAVREQGRLSPVVLAGGPDPAAVTDALALFGLHPAIVLAPEVEQGPMMGRLDTLWAGRTPAAVVVRGDSTGSLAAALAAHWRRVPVVHLDAGRRCGDLADSTVTEANRRLLAQVATVHLAAAPLAAMNLLDEKVPGGDVLLTGSTMVDASRALSGCRRGGHRTHRLVLASVSAARPESVDRVGIAVRQLAERYPDVEVVMWGLTPAPAFAERARLLAGAYLVLTDDEELQEEALAFGVPVLFLRESSEQPEALHAGCARLVGEDPGPVLAEACDLLDSRVRRDAMTAGGNPYGDGLAARRVAQATAALLGHGIFPDPMPGRLSADVSLQEF